ncbi:MAG TPA: 50S ribosomal protein L3, partial [Dehalococcoidia bacterium]|nr:50S ribosomal protein L3 [Dehalococcoidia bacterium]
FQGVIKRHGFSGGPSGHGSMSHRVPGSIGQCSYPSKVFKGTRMAGHMGNKQVTVRNLRVVGVDSDRHLVLVKGAVPGANKGLLLLRKAR